MHPVKNISRGRGSRLWWPAGLLLNIADIWRTEPLLNTIKQNVWFQAGICPEKLQFVLVKFQMANYWP